jgi:hypothetical protein
MHTVVPFKPSQDCHGRRELPRGSCLEGGRKANGSKGTAWEHEHEIQSSELQTSPRDRILLPEIQDAPIVKQGTFGGGGEGGKGGGGGEEGLGGGLGGIAVTVLTCGRIQHEH